MKKPLLLLLLLASTVSAQTLTSDIVADRNKLLSTVHVYEFNAGASYFACPGYDTSNVHPGYNCTITGTLEIGNLGPDDAHMGVGNVTPGVTYDACRGYNRYDNFCEFQILQWENGCWIEIHPSNYKAYYEVGSSQHYLDTVLASFQDRLAWLQQYCGIINYQYLNTCCIGQGGTTIAPIINTGWADFYTENQPYNWLNITGYVDQLVVGETYFFQIELNPYFLNQGANCAPDATGPIAFIWNGGAAFSRSLSPTTWVQPPIYPPSAPTGVQASSSAGSVTITWNQSGPVFKTWTLERIKITGQHQSPPYQGTPEFAEIVDFKDGPHATDELKKGGWYSYRVTANGCTGIRAVSAWSQPIQK